MFTATLGIISAEHLDAWTRMGAIPMLGAIAAGAIWVGRKDKAELAEAIKHLGGEFREAMHDVKEGIESKLDSINEANTHHLQRQIELLERRDK